MGRVHPHPAPLHAARCGPCARGRPPPGPCLVLGARQPCVAWCTHVRHPAGSAASVLRVVLWGLSALPAFPCSVAARGPCCISAARHVEPRLSARADADAFNTHAVICIHASYIKHHVHDVRACARAADMQWACTVAAAATAQNAAEHDPHLLEARARPVITGAFVIGHAQSVAPVRRRPVRSAAGRHPPRAGVLVSGPAVSAPCPVPSRPVLSRLRCRCQPRRPPARPARPVLPVSPEAAIVSIWSISPSAPSAFGQPSVSPSIVSAPPPHPADLSQRQCHLSATSPRTVGSRQSHKQLPTCAAMNTQPRGLLECRLLLQTVAVVRQDALARSPP